MKLLQQFWGHFRHNHWQDVKGVLHVIVLHETISLPVIETEMWKRINNANVKLVFCGTALHSYTPPVSDLLVNAFYFQG